MCDWSTAISLVIAAGSAYAQKRTDDRNQDAIVAQQRLNNAAARDAILRGRSEEEAFRRQLGQQRGAQRVAFAATGFDVGDSSAIDLFSTTAALGELDALAIRSNAEREAFGLKTGNAALAAQAQIDRINSRAAIGSSLLTGVARGFKAYDSYKTRHSAKPSP